MTRPTELHSFTISNYVFCYSVPENSSTVRKGVAIAGTFFHFLGQCLLSAGKRIINYPIHIISSRSDTVSSAANTVFDQKTEYVVTNLPNLMPYYGTSYGGFGLGDWLDEEQDI